MKPFIHFFSGAQGKQLIEAANEGLVHYVMPSFYYEQAIDKYPSTVRMIIDSGAHTLQEKGTVDDFEKYHLAYKSYILHSKRSKNAIWVELDVDQDTPVTIEQVEESRRDLEGTGNYIMPVWHKNRGLKSWNELTKKYPYVGLSALDGLTPSQLVYLVNIAYKNESCVHGFGCGRRDLWQQVPFFSVDSSSWIKSAAFGIIFDEQGKRYYKTSVKKKPEDYRVFLQGNTSEIFNRTANRGEHASWNIKQYLKFEENTRQLWLKRKVDFHWATKTLKSINW